MSVPGYVGWPLAVRLAHTIETLGINIHRQRLDELAGATTEPVKRLLRSSRIADNGLVAYIKGLWRGADLDGSARHWSL